MSTEAIHTDLFLRTRSVLQPDLLRDRHVLVVGLGSGGARVAEELVRFGVGRVTLVDRPGERIEPHNVIRHPLGHSAIGRTKVAAMRDRLLDINPGAEVTALEADVRSRDSALLDEVGRADLVLCCVDGERAKHALNRLCIDAGVTMVFAGVFDGGCGGEVGVCLPGRACYACVASQLQRRAAHREEVPASVDYSRPEVAEAPRTTAALNLDIAQIVLLQARVALLTLLQASGDAETLARLGGPLAGNYLLFGNRPVPGLFGKMLESELWELPRDVDCLICGDGRRGAVARSAGDVLAAACVVDPAADLAVEDR